MTENDKNITQEFEDIAIMQNFSGFMDFIETGLIKAGMNNSIAPKILTASEEIIVNIINYAYNDNAGKLKIEFYKKKDRIEISFVDKGLPFNPLEKPETNTKLSIDQREIGGLGILLVRKLMDQVKYEYRNGRNHFTIIKYL